MAASTAARFTTEIRQALVGIAARAPESSRLAGVASMPIPEAILHIRGVLNGINSLLQITDPIRRNQLLAAHLNVRDVSEVTGVILGALEGLVATTCLIGSVLYRMLGQADTASRMFRLGASGIVRRIGWIASLAQTVHGLSILLDDRSTENQRLQAVLDVGLGSAGLTGAAASLGVEALAGIAGPLSAGIVVTAGEVAFLRSQIRGMEEGMTTGGIRAAFDVVEYETSVVSRSANELAKALAYSGEAVGGMPGGPDENRAARERAVQVRATTLRQTLVRSIDRVSERQPDLGLLWQPAFWPQVWRPFANLRGDLGGARTARDLLGVANDFIEAARDLFRNFQRTIARTLLDVDRSRAGRRLPSLLGGLHSDRQEAASAHKPSPQMPVP
jgi:hypothetical protein